MSIQKKIDGPDLLLGAGVLAVLASGVIYFFFGSKRKRIISIAKGELGESAWHKYLEGVAADPGGPIAWCGIFALWVLHQAGLGEDVLWKYDGRGFLSRLPQTSDPQPGDLAYISAKQHHAIVEKVVGNDVYTLDGNSRGRQVAANVRPRSTFAAFYSIQPLLDGEQV